MNGGSGGIGGSITFQAGIINGATGGNGNDCEFGRCGGDGGHGGSGGKGGAAGNGGNGGSILVEVGIDNSTNSDPLDASGGSPGKWPNGASGGGNGDSAVLADSAATSGSRAAASRRAANVPSPAFRRSTATTGHPAVLATRAEAATEDRPSYGLPVRKRAKPQGGKT